MVCFFRYKDRSLACCEKSSSKQAHTGLWKFTINRWQIFNIGYKGGKVTYAKLDKHLAWHHQERRTIAFNSMTYRTNPIVVCKLRTDAAFSACEIRTDDHS